MGTRADYYIGRGEEAIWLGSSAWDSYPSGQEPELLNAATEEAFRAAVTKRISEDDGTKPEEGWPWPWDDSQTTDYAYAFDGGKTWASYFGHAWFDPLEEEPEHEEGKPTVFPNMKSIQKVKLGKGSGIMIIGLPK